MDMPLTVGVGLTVMIKVFEAPSQLLLFTRFLNGVTVIVATIGTVPGFTAVKLSEFPVPLAANPMPGLLFVQVK